MKYLEDLEIGSISHYLKYYLQNEDAMLLTTIPGIGFYGALLIISEIGDIHRFPSPEKLCSYARLVPSLHQSGRMTRYRPITKVGSRYLR